MRWIVEVSSVGKADKHAYCVESESWQRALQVARAIRGDNGPMTGFSIELLDDGFSAVDPMTRLRYFVKRTADDAVLTALPPGFTGKTPSVAPGPMRPESPSAGPVPAPAQPQPQPQPQPQAPVAAPKKINKAQTFVFGSSGAAAVLAEAKDPRPQAAPSAPPRPEPSSPAVAAAPPAAHAPAPAHAPVHAPAPAPAPAPVAVAPVAPPPIISPPTLPGIEVLHKREQDPDASSPLTYREYVYFFPAASSETMARAMLVAQFDLVRGTLENVRPGKLVNLAMFDIAFQGRPPVPPVVTLSWKDWKGEPAIDFPRRKLNAPASNPPPPVAVPPAVVAAPPPVAAVAPAPVAAPVPSPQGHATQPSAGVLQLVPEPTPPPPAVQPAAVQPVAAPYPPPPPGFPPPTIAASAATASPASHAQAPVAAPPPPAVEPSVVVAPAALAAPAARPPSQPPPPPREKRSSRPSAGRLRGDELIADLFEAMHDLHFLHDAVEGADFCLTLALEKIPSRVGLVHLYDIDRREFVVACARGPNNEVAILQRYPEGDAILAKAMRRQRAIVFANAAEVNQFERYAIFGGAKSLIVAPVMLSGRFLGAIELMDPLDGSPFSEDEGHALTYIGEQFAEFVSTRGVTVDPERIATSSRA